MSSEEEGVGAKLGKAVQDYQSVVDDYDRETARLLGVNETDLRCLEILMATEEAAPSTLSAQLGLTTGSVTTMLDRLEKAGYLTRTPHPTDRRRTLVRVTPEASEKTYALIAPFIEDSTRQVMGRYSAEQLELVADFLTFSRNIQQEHVRRLRELPAPGPSRSGGRQAPGPRRTGAAGTR
ncbi:MarR family winged helix-turn-helix transcriptional regulator [Streptomyces sp. NBC_01264]|uniref:MarR family winged helix-turn-helix transcriptional regulator n=1 Tax=Streptomyces sp. NBC_01264 TaxID=2903804 RepID=UPI00224D86EE|nr:MarR family transcriptional regulator [Streptomyces sp. NBC_01264]MCX4782712.1 MarR family transcriptional regulator [Streptomyces sp. NBC_01264]